jgi:butyryl-CoA dehydrogenase
VYPELTSGAAGILHTFGSKKLQETFIPKLLAGEWQGTMALTEPTAGSSLSDIVTTAVPTEQGHYLLKGQKAFLTAGDHNGVDNVVHLVVARIKGAENGIKGLSLFVVPKKRLNENDELVPNDVIVNRVVNKMGYRGVPITELSFGNNNDCHGYLVGESNQNLMYLFKVMNEPRIGVGTGAAALASAAYYTALEYCKTRSQGRKVTSKDSSAPQIPIIEHADVRRMLLFQRAIVEGSEALLLQCAKYEDNVKILPEEKTEHYRLLLDLLIPIAKSYPSEMGLLSISQSIQCLGGYGYCEDFPVEQYFRDARIHSIHQGTTGIQGKDLLGRKILMQEGKAFNLFLEETQKAIDAAAMLEKIKPLAYTFEDALNWLSQVTASLAKVMAKKGIDIYLADATLYLEAFSIITIAWQWLQQATAAQTALDDKNKSNDTNFYQGKLTTAKYFFAYELPKISGLIQRLTDGNPLTVNMKNCYFDD